VASALIVTAEIGDSDFAWLNRLRRTHFPQERNHLPAHLTIFHALPPSSEAEIRTGLAHAVRARQPKAVVAGLIDLGGGVAFRVVSEELDRIREELASAFHGLLSTQDAGGWRPHVTIQNKVAPKAARELKQSLEGDFELRPLVIRGLGLHRYLGGPWERLGSYSFRA
jgi:hypothetical protein